MRLFVIIFCFFLFLGCKNESKITKVKNQTEEKLRFPDDFLGIYKGTLVINNSRGKQEIPMEYHLLKTDTIGKYKYKLVYNGSPRNYYLLEKNKEKGIYEVDENNGIILPTHLKNNTLYSFFEVQGNLLHSRTKFHKNHLMFEILFIPLKQKIKSGGDNYPSIFGYSISTFQIATLKKENEPKE